MVSGSLPVPAKAAAVCTSGETSGYPSIGGERGGAEEALGLGGGSGKAASRGKAGVGMSSVPLPTKGVGVGTGIVFPALGRRDRVVRGRVGAAGRGRAGEGTGSTLCALEGSGEEGGGI